MIPFSASRCYLRAGYRRSAVRLQVRDDESQSERDDSQVRAASLRGCD